MNEKELFENAYKLLETHFKIKVDNEETLNAWKLFKEDFVGQIEENQLYKDKEDKLREYIKYHTDGGLWHIRGSEDVVKDVVENDILDILGENNND